MSNERGTLATRERRFAYLKKFQCLIIYAADGAGWDGSEARKETASTASIVDFSIPGSYALAHRLIHSFMSSQQQAAEGNSSIWRQAHFHTSQTIDFEVLQLQKRKQNCREGACDPSRTCCLHSPVFAVLPCNPERFLHAMIDEAAGRST